MILLSFSPTSQDISVFSYRHPTASNKPWTAILFGTEKVRHVYTESTVFLERGHYDVVDGDVRACQASGG